MRCPAALGFTRASQPVYEEALQRTNLFFSHTLCFHELLYFWILSEGANNKMTFKSQVQHLV